MKTKVFMLVLGIFTLTVMLWRFSLSAPLYYDADGSPFWKHTMVVTKQVSFWPCKTVYAPIWIGYSVTLNNVTAVDRRRFKFVLWNGFGIKTVKVVAVGKNVVLDGLFAEEGVSFPHEDRDVRFRVVKVRPPKGEMMLKITVTDMRGNVTEDVVNLLEYYATEKV